jgi:hypothetical protein
MATWSTHATIVTYALDNGTVNDEIIEAVLAMTALLDYQGLGPGENAVPLLEPTLDKMLLLQRAWDLVDGDERYKAKEKDSGIIELNLDAPPPVDFFADEVGDFLLS